MAFPSAGLKGLETIADQPRLLADQLGQGLGVVQVVQAVMGIDVAAHPQQSGGKRGQGFVGEQGDGDELAGDGGGAEDQRGLARQAEEAPAAQGAAQGGRVMHGRAPGYCRHICKVGTGVASVRCYSFARPCSAPR
ncbi:hypothetical protein FQZ97_1000190 [compost metagenome]